MRVSCAHPVPPSGVAADQPGERNRRVLGVVPALGGGKFTDGAAMLAFVAGAAVTIERIIEVVWTVLGGTLGTYWPLSWVRKQTDSLVTSLDSTLGTVQAQAQRVLAQVEGATVWANEQAPRLQSDLSALKERLTELRALTPDNQRLQLIATSAAQYLNGLEKVYADKSPWEWWSRAPSAWTSSRRCSAGRSSATSGRSSPRE